MQEKSLKHKASHADVHKQSHARHGWNDGGAPVAEHDEGNPNHGQETRRHAHIDDQLPENDRHHPHRNDGPELVLGILGNIDPPEH